MAEAERVICASAELEEAGTGVRFEVTRHGAVEPAFVVRYGGLPRAYLNRCAHVPTELDWQPGEFFDMTKTLLICSMHGAQYYPENGRCYLGPCRNGGLVPLQVVERDGNIILQE
ncbi:MAG TPA: Rieske 2Fe-2S domain-containing protein [Burkholderiales bacterium]|nr:Rieske 2Fe-2S domain-containing protein [Burkholderiales bacterium]